VARQSLYTGKSGQLAVMAEFVSRGYNVAVPEVDVGDDLFVVRDEDGELSRVQVKTANARELVEGGYGAAFKVPRRQLETPHRPEMNYVFAVRCDDRWNDFLVIDRKSLYDLHAVHEIGTELDGSVVFALTFSNDDVSCKGQSLRAHRNDWSRWPRIRHTTRASAPSGEAEP
jgi:hypothetical protein